MFCTFWVTNYKNRFRQTDIFIKIFCLFFFFSRSVPKVKKKCQKVTLSKIFNGKTYIEKNITYLQSLINN